MPTLHFQKSIHSTATCMFEWKNEWMDSISAVKWYYKVLVWLIHEFKNLVDYSSGICKTLLVFLKLVKSSVNSSMNLSINQVLKTCFNKGNRNESKNYRKHFGWKRYKVEMKDISYCNRNLKTFWGPSKSMTFIFIF